LGASVASSEKSRIASFISTPTISSATPAQKRVDNPVPLPRSTTSRGRSTPASAGSSSSSAAGGRGR